MANDIGSGVEALAEWMRRCSEAGGTPQIRTEFVRKFTSDVIVACYGAGKKVKGGTITDLPPQLVSELRSLHAEQRLDAVYAWLRKQGGSVTQPIAVASPY